MHHCQVAPPGSAVSLYNPDGTTVPSEPFPFLRLPSELRDHIYEFLLCTKHNKQKLTYDKPCWNDRCESRRPKHRYTFHVAVFRANRQIFQEANRVFNSSNLFVAISSGLTGALWANPLEHQGLAVISRVTDPSMLKHCAMHAMIAFGDFKENTDAVSYVKGWWGNNRLAPMVAADDLPDFCNLYLQLKTGSDWRYYDFKGWKQWALLLDVSGNDALCASDDLSVSRRTRTLLDPFLRFETFGSVHINGIPKGTYHSQIVRSITGRALSIEEVLKECSERQRKGEDAFRIGNNEFAIHQYRAAVTLIESGFSDAGERSTMLIGSQVIHISSAALEVAVTDFNLRMCLVYACQASRQFHDMHKWVSTALDVLLRWSDVICNGVARTMEISNLYYMSGLASSRMNSDSRALEEFDCALRFDPDHVMAKREMRAIKKKRAAGHGNSFEDQVGYWERSHGIRGFSAGVAFHP